MTYCCEAYEVHPDSQKLQHDAATSILRTFRNSLLARAQLVLQLLPVAAQATIFRLTGALKYRATRFAFARELIDTAIREQRPWGRLVQGNLDKYGLGAAWLTACAAVDAAPSADEKAEVLWEWKTLVAMTVQKEELVRWRNEVFTEVEKAQIPLRAEVHPICRGENGPYGYQLLRNEFLPPHILHGRNAPPDPPRCPCCQLGPDRPAHLLVCPAFGPSPPAAHDLVTTVAIWNLRDPAVFTPLLAVLKQRTFARFVALDQLKALAIVNVPGPVNAAQPPSDGGHCPPVESMPRSPARPAPDNRVS